MTIATTERPARTDMGRQEAEEITKAIKDNFDSLGKMLIEVRERKGYRALGYTSLESYCLTEFGKGRSRVYQLIEEAEIEAGIVAELAVTNSDIKSLKMPGSYLRELGSLESPQKQIEAIAYANRLAENDGKSKATKVHLQVAVHKVNQKKPEQTKEIIKTIGFEKGAEVEVLEGHAKGQRGIIRKIDKRGIHVELHTGNSIPIAWDISELRVLPASEKPKHPATMDTINLGDTVQIFSSNTNKGKAGKIIARVNDKLALVEIEGCKAEVPYAELELKLVNEDKFQPLNDSIWAGNWNKLSSWYYNAKEHTINSFVCPDLTLQPPAKCDPSDWLETWRDKNLVPIAEAFFTQEDLADLVVKTTKKMNAEAKQKFLAKINIHADSNKELSELRTRLEEAEATIQAMVNAASPSAPEADFLVENSPEIPSPGDATPEAYLDDWKSILISNNFTRHYHSTDDWTEKYRGWKIYLDPNAGYRYVDLSHPDKGAFCCDINYCPEIDGLDNEDKIIEWAKAVINQIEDFCPGQLTLDYTTPHVTDGDFPAELITKIKELKAQKQTAIEQVEHELATKSHTTKREKKLSSELRWLRKSLQNLKDVQNFKIGQIVRHKLRPEISGKITAFTLSQGGMPEVWVQWPNQTDEKNLTQDIPEKVQLLLADN
jgi:ribosomal protein L24